MATALAMEEARFTVQAYPDETFTGTVRQVRLQSTMQENVVNYTVVIDVMPLRTAYSRSKCAIAKVDLIGDLHRADRDAMKTAAGRSDVPVDRHDLSNRVRTGRDE